MKNWTSLLHYSLEEGCLQKAELMIPTYLKKINNNLNINIVYPKASKSETPVYGGKFKNMSGKNNTYTITEIRNIFTYLVKNAKKIDYLHLVHFIKSTILLGLIYKLINPKGKLYIMMDFDPYKHNISTIYGNNYPIIGKIIKQFINYFIKKTDCISIETSTGYKFLTEYSKSFKEKLIYMPNGFDIIQMNNYQNKDIEKENIILTVGRIGTYQKNTELLMKSIENLLKTSTIFKKSNWKCYCIGPIEPGFQKYIDLYYKKYPETKDRIIFKGPIFDKKELYTRYQKSKIFCLTSRDESFGIVLVEALYFNNYIITTNISSAYDITNGGELGIIVEQEDYKGICKAIENVIENYNYFSTKIKNQKQIIIKRFSWDQSIQNINNKLFIENQ